ncbi:MAG: GAF domain-containing protein, partial [Terriglobales bacterium]
ARMLTGARGVAITLAAPEKRFYSSQEEGLTIRSTVAAPIYESERIVGHLEIFSSELGAFDERDLSTLPVLAAVVGEMITLRAAEQRESARKAERLSSRIVSRIEGMLPTIHVRLVH